ncbi:MAG: ATP-binding protein [Desulfobacteraceae bacterium]|nr:ATP-binding protein [Desulfobacteraceae bacterium]
MTKDEAGKKNTNRFYTESAWKANLIVIGTLILLVLAYFFWQLRYAEKTFNNHAGEHARMLAGMIRLNADSSVLSQEIVEEIMATFLGNSARFVEYLDSIEPFSADELTAFAEESGLAGIRIVRNDSDDTEGPPGWFSMENTCQIENRVIRYLKNKNIYYLTLPGSNESACVTVGLVGKRIDKLKEQISLEHMLGMLSDQAGIRYVRIEPRALGHGKSADATQIRIVDDNKDKIAEVSVPLGPDVMVVGLKATHFFERVNQLRNEFVVFSIIIVSLGVFFSWLLYRYQNAHVNHVKRYERRLAAEKEDAALGRASSTITHEIRNPLNAISMGLQRLQMEADELDDEHRVLISNLLVAVGRTNSIISGLHRYAGPLVPHLQKVNPDSVVNHILTLYRQPCEKASVAIHYKPQYHQIIMADSHLLEEAVENLIKNAIEAQPNGGDIEIRLFQQGAALVISFENSGFDLSEKEAEKILEPYFTTKTRGSGLGLSISARIIRAHGGRMEVLVPNPGRLRINLFFPIERKYHENSRGR